MFSTKEKIGLLLAVHVIGVVVTAWLAAQTWTWVNSLVPMAIGYSQAAMLGTWCALGGSGSTWRLTGTLLGGVALWGLPAVMNFTYSPPMSTLLAVASVFAVLLLVWPRTLRVRIPDAAVLDTPRNLQYSIWHILVATSVAAVVLGLSRHVGRVNWGTISAVVRGPSFAPCVMASIWATLDTRLTPWRIVAVAVLGFVIGFVPQYFFFLRYYSLFENTAGGVPWWPHLLLWPTLFLSQTIIVLATLLVIRACGYRLVRSAKEG